MAYEATNKYKAPQKYFKQMHAIREVKTFYSRFVLAFCILGTFYFNANIALMMETSPITVVELQNKFKTYKGVFFITEESNYSSFITRLKLSEETLDLWAESICGVAEGVIFTEARMSLIGAFNHPVVFVTDINGKKILMMTLTHRININTSLFSGPTNFVNELDASMKYKDQYMSEVFLSLDTSTFVDGLNNGGIKFMDWVKEDNCKQWAALKEVKERIKALSEFSLAAEKLFDRYLTGSEWAQIKLKMTRIDSNTGDILASEYKKAKILSNIDDKDWRPYISTALKLKKSFNKIL